VTRLVDQVLDRLRADARIDASMLAIRIDALARFRRATEPYLPAEWLQPARAVAARAGERLAPTPWWRWPAPPAAASPASSTRWSG
jgi:hypothetical protein